LSHLPKRGSVRCEVREPPATVELFEDDLWQGEQDQLAASLFQVLRTPEDKLCQFPLTTSQFTIGCCWTPACAAALEGPDVDASDR
jgi:hypothetical protein